MMAVRRRAVAPLRSRRIPCVRTVASLRSQRLFCVRAVGAKDGGRCRPPWRRGRPPWCMSRLTRGEHAVGHYSNVKTSDVTPLAEPVKLTLDASPVQVEV